MGPPRNEHTMKELSVKGFLAGSSDEDPACQFRSHCSIPRWRRSSGGRNGNPLQYSCRKNPTDTGAWLASEGEVAESWTRLNTHSG